MLDTGRTVRAGASEDLHQVNVCSHTHMDKRDVPSRDRGSLQDGGPVQLSD